MFKRLSKIEQVLEEFKKDTSKQLNDIEKVLIVQESNLQKHMERSSHLEKLVEIESKKREDSALAITVNLNDTRTRLDKHINMIEGGLKLIGLLGILVGIAAGVIKILSFVI